MRMTVVAASYGGSEALSVIDEALPVPGPGEVRLRNRAIGVNPIDHKVYGGAMGADPARLPIRLGSESAGVVDAVGEGVVDIAVGEEVIAFRAPGAYTSDHIVKAQALTRKRSPPTRCGRCRRAPC